MADAKVALSPRRRRELSAGMLGIVMNLPTLATLALVLAYPIYYAAYLSLHKVSLAEHGVAGAAHTLYLADLAVRDPAGARGAAGHQPGALRGRCHRWRRRAAALSPHHAAAAAPDHRGDPGAAHLVRLCGVRGSPG